MPLARCTPRGATAPSGWRTGVESSDSPQPQRGRSGRVIAQTAVARRLGGLSPRFATSFSTASLAGGGAPGSWVPGGKGVPPATAGPRRPSQPGPSTLAWQRERCAVQQGPASLYRSLSARSANNLSVSARLLDRNLRNLRRKQEICAVKPAGSPRPISLTAHKTSRESVPPLRTNARLHQAAAAAARPGTGILGRVTSEGRAIMWGHGGSGTSKRGGGDAGWAL
jgi:hypothetical protein